MVSSEGLVESNVVDVVWDQGWRPASVLALRESQHGTPDSGDKMELPPSAVIFSFSSQFPMMCERLGRDHGGGKYIVIRRDGDMPLKNNAPGCVQHIFSIDVDGPDPRVTPMPTGSYAFSDRELLTEALKIPRSRSNLVLVSYSLDMPGSVYGSGHERITAIEYFKDKPWATVNEKILHWDTREGPVWPSWSGIEYLTQVRSHDSVVVPVGYGVDRMASWEAMSLGTIPISMKHSQLHHFAELPIAFVDNWSDVTPEWCDANRSLIELSTKNVSLEYWVERIKAKRLEVGLPEVCA